jgi:hypothetical protein
MAKRTPKERRRADDVTQEELEAQRAEELPGRDVMTTLSIDPPIPVEDADALFPIDPPPKQI